MNYLLIGKTNVGKSSIFNILTGSNYNIVHPKSGTTRDWHKEHIKNSSSYIYDTPGVLINDINKKNIINFSFNKIIEKKINIFLYVVDYFDGYNEIDHYAITKLREYDKDIILIVNKFDNFTKNSNNDFIKYGINKISYISCSHNYGIDKLKSIIQISKLEMLKVPKLDLSISILGKPNVGKSTFLNTVLGYERSLTSSKAGTTSDYVIDTFNFKKKFFKIIDTAGIGKKANIKNKSINYYSVKKSFEQIKQVDLAIVIVDAKEGLDRQDKRIIQLISNKAKSIILVFNKIDLINNKLKFKLEVKDQISYTLSEINNIKIFFISAFSSNHISKILNYLYNTILNKDYNISTSKLNNWLKKVTKNIQHPLVENKKINFKYAVQINNRPVTIKIFCNFSYKLKNHYKKYMINNFNNNFKILNQKTKFIFSSSKNPYV